MYMLLQNNYNASFNILLNYFLKAELKTIVLAVNFFRISWKNTQVRDELILVLKRAKFILNSKIRKTTIEICVPVCSFTDLFA